MKHPIRGMIALGLLTLIAADSARADDPRSIANGKQNALQGADVYNHVCQACHMPDGKGAVGAGAYPKLANNPAFASWQYVAVTVLNGRKAMPPFGISAGHKVISHRALALTDAQIADVVNYVRSHFGNRYQDKVTAEQVATLPHPDQPLRF